MTTRRQLLKMSGATLAGLPLINTTFAATLPVLPNSVVSNLHQTGELFVRNAKARTLSSTHVGMLSATLNMTFGLAAENGSIARLQNTVTPAYINAYEWTQTQKEALATLVTGSEPTDYNGLDIPFATQRSQINPNVSQSLATMLKALQTQPFPIVVAAYGWGGYQYFKRILEGHICWPGVYAAGAGLFAAASWEIPPISFAFGLLAFGYAIEAAVVC